MGGDAVVPAKLQKSAPTKSPRPRTRKALAAGFPSDPFSKMHLVSSRFILAQRAVSHFSVVSRAYLSFFFPFLQANSQSSAFFFFVFSKKAQSKVQSNAHKKNPLSFYSSLTPSPSGLLLLPLPALPPLPLLPLVKSPSPFFGGGLTNAKSTDIVWSSSLLLWAPAIAALASRWVGYSTNA